MIDFDLDLENGIIDVRPSGPLSAEDFKSVAAAVDPYIEQEGEIQGVIIHAVTFPGWKDFAGLIGHLKFIRMHHEHIKKVAVVSDDVVMEFLPGIAAHFVRAEIRHFPYGEYEAARNWIQQ